MRWWGATRRAERVHLVSGYGLAAVHEDGATVSEQKPCPGDRPAHPHDRPGAPVAVLGAGGVGGLIAGALARAGTPVILVARRASARAIRAGALTVHSEALGDFSARPQAVEALRERPSALILATKSVHLSGALGRVLYEPPLVVPLLNGIEHLTVLRERFGAERVLAAVIRVHSDRPAPGLIVQRGPVVRIDMAPAPPAARAGAGELARQLQAAGIRLATGAGEAEVMWGKLARLCPLALATSAYDAPLGPLREDPRRRAELEEAIAEVVAVANAHGAGLDPSVPAAELRAAHPGLDSSMRRDLAAGRPTELDAIAGAVLRAAAARSLSCPTIERLAGAVADRERRGRRPQRPRTVADRERRRRRP